MVSPSRVWGLWSKNGILLAVEGSGNGNVALHCPSEGRQWWMVGDRGGEFEQERGE